MKIQKALGNYTLSISATGSPSENASRGYQQRIATHNKDFAHRSSRAVRRTTNGCADTAWRTTPSSMMAPCCNRKSGRLRRPERLVRVQLGRRFRGRSLHHGLHRHDRPRELRRQLQRARGMLNNEVLYERQGKYHKPLFSLRHSGASPTSCTSPTWPTRVTATAGTRLENNLGGGDYTPIGDRLLRNFTTRTPSVCSAAIQRTATLC